MNWFAIGAVGSGLGVALGAFGAHALKTRVEPDLLAVFETGVRYQMYHALALLALAVWIRQQPSALATTAAWAFTIGIVVFSGSLYTLSLSGVRAWGAVTPLGGVAFLTGWVCLVLAALRATRG